MAHPLINISRKQALSFASFLVLYQFLTYIANDMIMPGMIQVVSSFHGPESAIASSLTAYILGGASLQLFLGPISDRIGRRPVMLAGAILFFVFTVFIACSNSIGQFLLARYFEGMGLCFIGVIGYATLQEIFAEMDAVRLVAALANVASLAPLLGPLAGATFILYFNWRGIFALIGFFALLALWGLWRFMPEPVGAQKKDGQVIPRVSLAPKVVFKNYLQLLTNPTFMVGAWVAGLVGVPCVAWIAISPIIIVADAKLSVIAYALWQLPIFGAGLLGNWYLHKLTRKKPIKPIILFGSILSSAGLLLAYLLPGLIGSNFEWLLPGLTLYGFGLGVTAAPLNRYVLFSTSVSKGTAYAMISLISMIAQAIGVEAANQVYTHHNNNYFGLYCAILGLIYLLGLVGMFVLSLQAKDELSLSAPAV
ncbi:multidrug efflux system protein [Legionella beliardensis]|uniref:Multidrug transporter MdfA n=1 Tax=Legionella beliardensis TaxID=91822 RepID=A0A378I4I1_9GAMM|nr:MdfA family multidrug efflux MFS transporter [Legionella beliardensis]STX29913.1 multidrug efflux system protein [Legionella beliardensis]